MAKIKILFLDLDGVLCTDRSFAEPKLPFCSDFHIPFRTGWDRLDKECITKLNKIIETTDAKIVISSTWRLSCYSDLEFSYLTDYLYSEGIIADIIDKTPTHCGHERIRGRGNEIQQWLDDWTGEPIESFVILDDDCDMDNLSDLHVCTDEPTGLQDHDIKRAIEILNG